MEKASVRTVIILGTSRNDGDTHKVVNTIQKQTGWDLLNLSDYDISHYDYAHQNRGDDFLPLMRHIVTTYDVLVFATPVYWYAMSGIMKVFFDRLTDLLTIEKGLGRKLRGKGMAVVSSSNGGNLGDFFWKPFEESASYLGMHYLGNAHTYPDKDNSTQISDLIHRISNH